MYLDRSSALVEARPQPQNRHADLPVVYCRIRSQKGRGCDRGLFEKADVPVLF
jgi:hypothetical protein